MSVSLAPSLPLLHVTGPDEDYVAVAEPANMQSLFRATIFTDELEVGLIVLSGVHGVWSAWSTWTPCLGHCCSTNQTRNHVCTPPLNE